MASASLQSNHAYALFSIDEATKGEQLAQIAQAETMIQQGIQMLEHVFIGQQLATVFNQMGSISIVVEEVSAIEVPERFVSSPDIMTDQEYADLRDDREAYYRDIDAQIRELEKEIALDENQLDTLMMASEIAAEPPSDITATQAQFLGDASRLEQQRRQAALEILRQKRADIKEQLTTGDQVAFDAVLECLRTCK